MSDNNPVDLVLDVPPLIIPAPGYAEAWCESLVDYSPDLRSIALQLFARLANWECFEACVAAASGTDEYLIDLRSLATPDRIAYTAYQREIMVQEFGIRPRCANVIAWNNPVGACSVYLMDMESSEVFLPPGDIDPLQLEEEFRELDSLNRSMLLDTGECGDRLQEFTRPELYAALFKHLGWTFTPSDLADESIHEAMPVNMIGHLSDAEIGEVRVYCASFSSNPNLKHDEPENLALLTLYKRQQDLGSKVLMMYSHPLVRTCNHPITGEEIEFSSFGQIFLEGMTTWLLLPSKPITFADLFVELVSTHKSGMPAVYDAGHETALRFEHMRRRKDPLIVETKAVQPVVSWSATGWDSISFEPIEA